MSSAVTDAFTEGHHRCDRLLAEAERQVAAGDWPAAAVAAAALIAAMEQRFAVEEGILFPELAQVFRVAENPMADGALPMRGVAIADELAARAAGD